MVPFYASPGHAERTATLLRYEILVRGVDIEPDQYQDVVARMHGFPGWSEMANEFGKHPLTPLDNDDVIDAVDQRRELQRQEVLELLENQEIEDAEAEAEAIVRDIGASSVPRVASWIDDNNRQVSLPCAVHVIEHDGATGVAISIDDNPMFTQRVTYFLMVKDGELLFGHGDDFVPSIERATAMWRDEVSRSSGRITIFQFRIMGDLLGYDQAHSQYRLRDKRDRVPKATEARLARARRVLEDGIGEAVGIVMRCGRDHTHELLDAYRVAGPVGDARRAFAVAWPDFADAAMMPPEFRARSVYALDAETDPDSAMALLVMKESGLDHDASMQVVERLRGRRWPVDHSNLGLLFHMIQGLPDDRVPRKQRDIDAFIEICKFMNDAILHTTPDREPIVARLIDSLYEDSWNASNRRMQQIAYEKALEAGWDAERDESVPFRKSDLVWDFYKFVDNMISTFMWSVAEPAAALTSDAVRYVHLRSRSGALSSNVDESSEEAGFVIPPTEFENACTHLFLDGLEFDGLVSMCAEWLRRMAANDKFERPASLDEADIGVALDRWRHLMRPQHRGISVRELGAAAIEGVRRQGYEISELSPVAQLMVGHMG